MVEKLFELSHFYLKNCNKPFKRFFLKKHTLDGRFYIVTGQRGVGKTTALIQHMVEQVGKKYRPQEILYLPVDHTLLSRHNLYALTETFVKEEGIKCIFYDEIHKYNDWSRDLKSVYDSFPALDILASGSSAMEIHKSSHDLSRRAVVYSMPGMSFREFLELTLQITFPSYSLADIVSRHEEIAREILGQCETVNARILHCFKNYLKYGYYPYFVEHEACIEEFYLKLEQDVRKTIEIDSMNVYPNLNGSSLAKILKLLGLLTQSVPYTPDLNDLKRKLEIGDIRTLKMYLKFLEDGKVLRAVSKKGKSFSELEKPAKIYLDNTNLIYALGDEKHLERGNIRETFFANMLSAFNDVKAVEKGDFMVDQEYIFEVGGKSKGAEQIRGIADSFLVLDDLEIGRKQGIPLWIFGFLY